MKLLNVLLMFFSVVVLIFSVYLYKQKGSVWIESTISTVNISYNNELYSKSYISEEDLQIVLLNSILRFEPETTIKIELPKNISNSKKYLTQLIQENISYIRKEHPEIFWLGLKGYTIKYISETTESIGSLTIKFNYSYLEEEKDIVQINLDNVIDNILVNSGETNFDKIKYFHDWIVNNTKYDIDAAESDAIDGFEYSCHIDGVFLKGKAVCEGYSKAFKVLCDRAGIPCKIVFGEFNGENHGWNYVFLDGTWYLVDVTSDDPISIDNNDIIRWDYFLVGLTTEISNKKTVQELYINDNENYPKLSNYSYDEKVKITNKNKYVINNNIKFVLSDTKDSESIGKIIVDNNKNTFINYKLEDNMYDNEKFYIDNISGELYIKSGNLLPGLYIINVNIIMDSGDVSGIIELEI